MRCRYCGHEMLKQVLHFKGYPDHSFPSYICYYCPDVQERAVAWSRDFTSYLGWMETFFVNLSPKIRALFFTVDI